MTECSRVNFVIREQVEFNPYIYTLSNLSRFGNEISVFNAQQGGIKNSGRNSRPIRHGNSFMEKWMSKFFLCPSQQKKLEL